LGLLGYLAWLSGALLLVTYQGQVLQWSVPWFVLQTGEGMRTFSVGIYVDFAAAAMLCMVSWIGGLVYGYSMAYMPSATAQWRYFGRLVFSVVAMLGLVVADNLLLLWIAWELVGWGAFGLIGFWYQQPAVAAASVRAWLVNQLGSVSLLAGILLVGSRVGAWEWTALAAWARETPASVGWLAGLLLMGGVVTKGVQFPLFYWLPRAMVAPTPASALLHAATVVSAGAYLFIKVAGLLPTGLLTGMAMLGSVTALLGACAACAQYDVKKMLAYSTVSQLGLVVMAVGVGASSAGLFHLIVHAFCKAGLFLGAGAVAYFLQLQGVPSQMTQDMRKMGGMAWAMPSLFCAHTVVAWSLVGLPGSAGFLSKKAVLASAFGWAQQQAQAGHPLGYVVPCLGLLTTGLSAFYLGRQWVSIFLGAPQWTASRPLVHEKAAAVPLRMQLSLWALAVCSLGCCYGPQGWHFQHSWLWQGLGGTSVVLQAATPVWSSSLAVALGFGVVAASCWLAPKANPFPQWLQQRLFHGWYLEATADVAAQQVLGCSRLAVWIEQWVLGGLMRSVSVGYVVLGHVVDWLDRRLVEGLVVGLAGVPRWLGRLHRWTQQGHWQHTLGWMLVGLGLLCGVVCRALC
ncbi:MAG: NADH-quinone oxidoreductase subunit L, partial [Bacteroidota bacterium]